MDSKSNKKIELIPKERIISKIFFIRNKKVMVDRDLAELYGVETRVLNQAVRRNIKRFPPEFMFQLNKREMEIWISQFVISKEAKRGARKIPLVFTEQGVAMLSSVLKSDMAIQINIQIINTFVKMRELLSTHRELREKVGQSERKYNKQFKIVFEVLGQILTAKEERANAQIGFARKSGKTKKDKK